MSGGAGGAQSALTAHGENKARVKESRPDSLADCSPPSLLPQNTHPPKMASLCTMRSLVAARLTSKVCGGST